MRKDENPSSHERETPHHNPENQVNLEESAQVAALLLTNVATIASNEVSHRVLYKPTLFRVDLQTGEPDTIIKGAVSTALCQHHCHPPSCPSSDEENSAPRSPPKSPPLTSRSKSTTCKKQDNVIQKPCEVRAVLRKKFSWKDFPELEHFLSSHREEYLRHASSHNYTLQQKEFNNQLTKGLLDVASEHGYVFENFSFVMLRDRVRCYYKSYLQAMRKQESQKK